MKRIIFLLITCACILSTHAQMTVISHFSFDNRDDAITIPQEFSYDNSPKLTMYNFNPDSKNVLIYDENLSLIKTINLERKMTFDYQLSYNDEKREIKAVKEISKHLIEDSRINSYQDFIAEGKFFDSDFEKRLTTVILENGDSLITIDSDKYSGMHISQNFFFYNQFGRKYPINYWIFSKGKAYNYRANYEIEYTDWHPAGTHIFNGHKEMEYIKLLNINLNNSDAHSKNYFIVSQTLFNNDAEYEYIVPKYKLSSKGYSDYFDQVSPYDPNRQEIDTIKSTLITKDSEIVLAGFKIMSVNGTVVKDLDFSEDFEGYIDTRSAYVITIGKNTYLAFNGIINRVNSTVFYKINRTTTEIKQVKMETAAMTLSPVVAERNATIDINLKDDNNAGSEIAIISTNGTQVKRISMPANQTTSQININAPAGLYCVSRMQKGKVVETKKIVIK